MSFRATLAGGILTVDLPPRLGLDNRRGLIEAIEGERGRYVRLRLDASAVAGADSAGLGVLARAVRLAHQRTSRAPLLHAPTECMLQLLRSVSLLNSFELEVQPG